MSSPAAPIIRNHKSLQAEDIQENCSPTNAWQSVKTQGPNGEHFKNFERRTTVHGMTFTSPKATDPFCSILTLIATCGVKTYFRCLVDLLEDTYHPTIYYALATALRPFALLV